MWHPHLRRKKSSSNDLEVVDSIGKDNLMLWKIFSEKNKDTKIINKSHLDTSANNLDIKNMRCECKFVKSLFTESESKSESNKSNSFPFNKSENNSSIEKNKLKSLLKNNKIIQRESSQNSFTNDHSNFLNTNTYLNKKNDILNFDKINPYSLQSSYNNIGDNFRMKELENTNFKENQNKNLNDIIIGIKNFLQTQSNKKNNKFSYSNENNSNFPFESEFPKSKISNEIQENLSQKDILYYLQLNSMLMKNLETLLTNKSIQEKNNSLEYNQDEIFSDSNSAIKNPPNNFQPDRKKSESNYGSNQFSNRILMNQLKLKREKLNLEENFQQKEQIKADQKTFDINENMDLLSNTLNNLDTQIGKNFSNDEFLHSSPPNYSNLKNSQTESDESNDLLQIAKNLNLNFNSNSKSNINPSPTDNKELPQLDFSKYKELLK